MSEQGPAVLLLALILQHGHQADIIIIISRTGMSPTESRDFQYQ